MTLFHDGFNVAVGPSLAPRGAPPLPPYQILCIDQAVCISNANRKNGKTRKGGHTLIPTVSWGPRSLQKRWYPNSSPTFRSKSYPKFVSSGSGLLVAFWSDHLSSYNVRATLACMCGRICLFLPFRATGLTNHAPSLRCQGPGNTTPQVTCHKPLVPRRAMLRAVPPTGAMYAAPMFPLSILPLYFLMRVKRRLVVTCFAIFSPPAFVYVCACVSDNQEPPDAGQQHQQQQSSNTIGRSGRTDSEDLAELVSTLIRQASNCLAVTRVLPGCLPRDARYWRGKVVWLVL